MLKYISKNVVVRLLIIAGVVLFLFIILTPDNPPMWFPSYNTNEYIPMDGRIAVYIFTGYKKGLGIKYIEYFDHDGTRFYAPPSDHIPANIITRKSLFEYRLYKFSHFIVGESPEYDAAIYDLTPYDFNDILEIYDVKSARDIKSFDHYLIHYSEGTVKDRTGISALYDVISDMECVPCEVDRGSVFGTRITLNLRGGRSIDRLYYSRARGMIYYDYHIFGIYSETGFAAYLDEAQQAQIEALIYD